MIQLEIGGHMEETRRTNFVATETESVVLNCSSFADPQPTVTWLLNGVELDTEHAGKYDVQTVYENVPPIGRYSEILTILGVVESDEGNYTCQVQNRYSDLQEPTMDSQTLQITGQYLK